VDRRTFLQGSMGGLSALAGWQAFPAEAKAGVLQTSGAGQSDFPADNYQMPEWLHYAQPVYFDGYSPPLYPHLTDFDAKRLVDIVLELGGNLLRFQPIGYWAYYPSKSFRVFPELGGRDLINEVSRECRPKGVHCYCYTGYGHPHMEVGWAEQHPEYADWVMRDPEGKPYGTYNHIGWPMRQRVCTTGDAYRAGIRQVVKELCEHDIDGVYFDAPSGFGYTGICFCDSCRHNFKKFSGLDLDRLSGFAKYQGLPFEWGDMPADVDIEAITAWYAWANQQTKEDLLDFRQIIHGSGKFMMCHNGQAWLGTSLFLQYRIPEGFMVEASRDVHERLMRGMKGASMARPHNKVAQMYLGGYMTSYWEEPPHERPWVVHNTNVEDGDEIRMEGFTNLACGNTPLYATANRFYFKVGSGSAKPAQEVYAFMRRVEGIHKGSVPAPYVSIVPTWESLQLFRTKRKSWNWPMMTSALGLALLDQRISVDVHVSTEMSDAWFEKQRVIALCGASGISTRQAEKLAKWVDGGGGLLATYDTGLYDEHGEMRKDGGALGEVLGVRMIGEPSRSQPECFYRVKEAHPALGELEAGAVVQGDGRFVPTEILAGAKLLAECWNLGTGEVRGPAVVVNNYGKGKAIYSSGSLETNYLYDRVKSTGQMLAAMVRYLGGGTPQPYTLKAPTGVYAVLRRATNEDLALWVLANVGFKDAVMGRMRQEYLPLSQIEVGIRIPEGKQAKAMRLMRGEQSVPFKVEGGYAVATIPTLHIAEVVHLALV
jgi:hypothetical protein